jgi:hypothetical protein
LETQNKDSPACIHAKVIKNVMITAKKKEAKSRIAIRKGRKKTTKFDECLREIDNELNDYIKTVGEFQIEEGKWVFDHYEEDKKVNSTCQLCEEHPLRHLYFIRNVKTDEKMILGSRCIKNNSNVKIGQWVESWQKRREQLLGSQLIGKQLVENKKIINILQGFIQHYENGTLDEHVHISEIGYERLKAMLENMCRGYKPRQTHMGLFLCYVGKIDKNADKKH